VGQDQFEMSLECTSAGRKKIGAEIFSRKRNYQNDSDEIKNWRALEYFQKRSLMDVNGAGQNESDASEGREK
jgi:hypothetical protein